MTGHESHVWGPHKDGIRWVQCQVCEALLHEPEAELECAGSPVLVLAGRAERQRAFMVKARRWARQEAGYEPGTRTYPSTGYGLWQIS